MVRIIQVFIVALLAISAGAAFAKDCPKEKPYYYAYNDSCNACPIGKLINHATGKCECPPTFLDNGEGYSCRCPKGLDPYYGVYPAVCTNAQPKPLAKKEVHDGDDKKDAPPSPPIVVPCDHTKACCKGKGVCDSSGDNTEVTTE